MLIRPMMCLAVWLSMGQGPMIEGRPASEGQMMAAYEKEAAADPVGAQIRLWREETGLRLAQLRREVQSDIDAANAKKYVGGPTGELASVRSPASQTRTGGQ